MALPVAHQELFVAEQAEPVVVVGIECQKATQGGDGFGRLLEFAEEDGGVAQGRLMVGLHGEHGLEALQGGRMLVLFSQQRTAVDQSLGVVGLQFDGAFVAGQRPLALAQCLQSKALCAPQRREAGVVCSPFSSRASAPGGSARCIRMTASEYSAMASPG